MLGAIIGDIVGSRFEFHNIKSKYFELFHPKCRFTDDSVMTIAVAKSIMEADENYSNLGELAVKNMRELGRAYPRCGYGGMFFDWLMDDDPQPYNSFGNGAAMRVSPCGFAAKSLKEAIALSRAVTQVTHNHPEGLKGAEATAVAVYLAKKGKSKCAIRWYISRHYYKLNFKLADIRDSYHFDETCQGSVPYAITAFLESRDFVDAIRNAISIGGDSDTIAAITGGIAEAYYGVPEKVEMEAMQYLEEYAELKKIIASTRNKYFKDLQ